MKKFFAAIALFTLAAAAQATTFGFADSSQNDITSTHGFTFSGGDGDYSWINGTKSPIGGPSTTLGYAWSNGGTDLSMTSTTGAFTFNSVSLYESNLVPVMLTGYLNGLLVKSYTATLIAGAYSTVTVDWSGVDKIVFSNSARANLLVTDITVNATNVPEPGSIALLGLGLAGFAAVRRQTKKAA